jgi:hypothetical protein
VLLAASVLSPVLAAPATSSDSCAGAAWMDPVGTSSADLPLTASLRIAGAEVAP